MSEPTEAAIEAAIEAAMLAINAVGDRPAKNSPAWNVARAIDAAVEAEREACAALAHKIYWDFYEKGKAADDNETAQFYFGKSRGAKFVEGQIRARKEESNG